MHENFQKRALEFQRRIADENIDVVLIYDPDNIYFLSAYWGYLGMDFGRPTVMIVPKSGSPVMGHTEVNSGCSMTMSISRSSR